ncbi:ABC transporter ATP-binding protein [Tepidibacter aestuarii]|uniref:ABC transporter ATP-binding protein n=1 Tax=Tepidibacter aestuarii TaxID=2925782 RepID=UPI0020C0EF91|nr:ABC transporter ATP-binding protein [Tepidibacter aestuarii]CAH2214621.1 glycine betaine/carnitine/choline/choline ABC transporter (ATP-binding protein) [Tepidibacter aestuarii]
MIKFENIKKSFDKSVVINNLNLEIKEGEFVVFIGESGCGKTTTMKMINKLIEPTEGKIYINGKDISKVKSTELRRNIGYVIQRVGLFPHMTVGENIELVPLLKKWEEKKRHERARELLDLVGLPANEYYDRYPHELSGGQQQRVGIARALAVNPDIILMDEPFSALDPITREQLQDEMVRLQEELGKTIVLVSHDMDEAIKLADKIAVMNDSKVVQYASPEEILINPANEFVENFVGKDRLWRQPEMLSSKDIMIKDYPKVFTGRSIVQAIERMKERQVEFLIVIDKENNYQGYVTRKEFINTDSSVKMKDIKNTSVEPINEDLNLVEVIDIMKKKHVRFLPVTNKENVVKGVITKSSLLNVISDLINID